jgi:hypothetical protein
MVRVMLIGNCQVEVYRQLLAASGTSIAASAVEVWRHKPAEFDRLGEAAAAADVVVAQELSAHYGALSTAALRSRGGRLLVVQNIYFQGYHPDCGYVGPMGGRLKSPVGDYHSVLTYECWSAGRTVADTVAALRAYPESRVREAHARSADELRQRERHADVAISDVVLDPEGGYRMLHTFNHPTLELHRIYLQRILRALDLRVEVGTCADPLALHTGWPVYPSVRRALGLPLEAESWSFRASASLGGLTYDPQSLVEASFALYERSRAAGG